ncbi:hypothetical protein P152DRAFT_409480 [Eremomyces bilateralis CBS 781.70]|uniref:Hemerythrin-like domain-containing protein n=1 Tax=Eremomyces bilateralis CBS 781.70 TaxID=1392243 RepID=A0A6G1GEQ8_9PEZI|nr:uncharacterized protein P152DRAFT_409480 [Eremomyces bilateralis CBS 781.70]KAF1816514.1 hypothetical protein P152DRAFT_409480 [Eremomyces bilateralis CBS 781.70]
MTQVHCMLLRGLNVIVTQAAPVATRGTSTDVRDFMHFVRSWVIAVIYHHDGEETFLFPGLQTIVGNPDAFADEMGQHRTMHARLETVREYARRILDTREVGVEEYKGRKGRDLKRLCEELADVLVVHLSDEVQALQGADMRNTDEKQLKAHATAFEAHLTGDTRPEVFEVIMPILLGCSEKGFRGSDFPTVPFFFPYLIHYWYARKYHGA